MKPFSLTLLTALILSVLFTPQARSEDAASNPSTAAQAQTVTNPASFEEDWDPFEEMDRMERNMDKIFREGFRRVKNYQQAGKFFEPDTDFLDKGDKYLLRMDIPGMAKDQIQINATDGSITVSGERHTEKQETADDKGYYRIERSSGSFRRTLPLPPDSAAEKISAKYENGVLEITVPKQETKLDPSTKIQIQ
jgi:HSP20 family protein